MEILKKNLESLKLLSDCKKKIRNNIIKKGKRDLILSINECVVNTLNGNVKLTTDEKEKLKKFKYTLRNLLKKKSISKKKQILIQQGGFLQVLLPSAITLIGTIIEHLVNRKK